jgi:hypothetical protein
MMNIMRLLFIATCSFSAICSAKSAVPPMSGLLSIEGKVTEVSVPLAGSGYVRTFVATTVAAGKREVKLLIPFFLSNRDSLPAVGHLCVFTYKKSHVDEWAGQEGLKPGNANVVTRFTCAD